MFIAAALERAVGSVNKESEVGTEKEREEWALLGARGCGGRWCLRTRFLACAWRNGGDIQDSDATTSTGAGDGAISRTDDELDDNNAAVMVLYRISCIIGAPGRVQATSSTPTTHRLRLCLEHRHKIPGKKTRPFSPSLLMSMQGAQLSAKAMR